MEILLEDLVVTPGGRGSAHYQKQTMCILALWAILFYFIRHSVFDPGLGSIGSRIVAPLGILDSVVYLLPWFQHFERESTCFVSFLDRSLGRWLAYLLSNHHYDFTTEQTRIIHNILNHATLN
jgi:hypothetical protein